MVFGSWSSRSPRGHSPGPTGPAPDRLMIARRSEGGQRAMGGDRDIPGWRDDPTMRPLAWVATLPGDAVSPLRRPLPAIVPSPGRRPSIWFGPPPGSRMSAVLGPLGPLGSEADSLGLPAVARRRPGRVGRAPPAAP